MAADAAMLRPRRAGSTPAIPRALAGIPIGQGTWVIEIAEDQFTAAASGATTGTACGCFTSGHGTGASRGTIVGRPAGAGDLLPPSITYDKKTDDVRIDARRRQRQGISPSSRRCRRIPTASR